MLATQHEHDTYRYLAKRNGIFWFKRTVPRELQAAFGAHQIWKSLRTSDLPRAVDLLTGEIANFEARAILARRELGVAGPADVVREHHIRRLCERFSAICLETDDDERRGMSVQDVTERRELLAGMLETKKHAVATEDHESVVETANTLLDAEGMRLPPEQDLRLELLRRLLATDLGVLQAQLDRLNGRSIPTPPCPQPVAEPTRLGDIVALWVRNQAPVPKTRWETEHAIKRFERVCGRLGLVDITTQHAGDYVDYLECGEKGAGNAWIQKPLARKTIEKQMSLLNAVFAAAINVKDKTKYGVTTNPFHDICPWKKAKPAHRKKYRRPFDPRELQLLFDSKVFRQGYRPKGPIGEAAYWLPLLAAFTGARPEELGQLRVVDVLQLDDAWIVRICDLDEDLHLKTPESFRRVPVHAELIRLGFIEYHREVARAGERFLFPLLKPDKYGKRTFAFGRWINRYLDSIGLDERGLDFYSLRGTFKDLCRVAGIHEEVHDNLTGHKPPGRYVSRNYGAANHPVPPLLEAMAKFRLVGVDLSNLPVVRPPTQSA